MMALFYSGFLYKITQFIRRTRVLGAIIADIVGSRFGWTNIKSKEFEFLTYRCAVTDDSVMSLAVAQAILDCAGDYADLEKHAVRRMQELGRMYPHSGYGGMFKR
jgi:type I restriction enzyme M protein